MTETKRNVFEQLLKAYQDLISKENDDENYRVNITTPLNILYDAALPDDLPVIPKVWGDTIEEFKANHYRLSEIFTEWDWNYDEQELIASAWVLGVWRVEETGEIVKLEAEK
ncbi:hypothetical protein [Lacticaseibacillus paracasei]|uniref:Phage protein n=1 Tax=Lacticaseibacillus paracasei TaxID=1597 RepID=A0A422M0D1_LACPA|nr:hypothetical protein [Lacticaseibacillus paracasei]RND80156.1 hypothetical protein FAM18157_02189 [Lacticaseibacillus paracasei]